MDNDDKRDPVIINNERKSNPLGWIIGLAVVLILVLVFFATGGFGLFNSAATDDSNSINVDTPDSVNVQPSGQ